MYVYNGKAIIFWEFFKILKKNTVDGCTNSWVFDTDHKIHKTTDCNKDLLSRIPRLKLKVYLIIDKFMAHFYRQGSTALKLQSHHEETYYFQPRK